MPQPFFQGTEEVEEGASSGETRSSAVMEGHARRAEDHPPVQREDRSEDLQALFHAQGEPAAPIGIPSQQHQSSAALGNQSLGSLQQHSHSSAENQRPFPEQQASATADPYSSGVTEHLSSASSEPPSLAPTEQQLWRTTEHMSPASSISSGSADVNRSSMAEGSMASTGHHPSSPSQLPSSASAEHQVSSSAEEQHPLLPAEQPQATETPNTLGPPARRPVTQSHVERGELYVSGDNSDAVSRARNDEVPENRMGTGSDVSESSQPRERGSSVPDCIRCETVRLELHPESCQLWSDVPGPCCRKICSELLKTLRKGFVGDKCLHNKCALNLLKHMLGVPLPENTEVSLQKFRDAERFLGPFVLSNGRCAFLANVEKLATKSRSGRQNKLSWFAGHMDSITAENYLDGKRKGTFLVRFSSTSPASEGSFVISVVAEAQTGESCVQHFLVQGNPEATRNDPSSLHLTFQGRQFPSLIEVVDHARRQGVTVENQGRVTFTEVCHGLPLQSALTPYR